MAQLAPFRVYDLLHRAQHAPGYTCWGREQLLGRLARSLARPDVRHIGLRGKAGSGKSIIISEFAAALGKQRYPGLRPLPVLQLDTTHLIQRLARSSAPEALLAHFEQALAALPPCRLVIDDADEFLAALADAQAVPRVMAALGQARHMQLIVVFAEEAWPKTEELLGAAAKFTMLDVDELSVETCRTILRDRARYIAGQHRVRLEATVPEVVVEFAQRLAGRAEPNRSLQLLQEVCAAVTLEGRSVIKREDVARIMAERTGQAATNISGQSAERLKTLRAMLKHNVIGQEQVVEAVAATLERGWLGLKNPDRPLGSFLFFGPSGVGKTELARVIAREVYGTPQAFVRIDMSEYGEAHTVQRLIGAPPGYVGYEAGGQLTEAVRRQPFSLILLDEIEKADPRVFDIFLQILEDGRLTDGQGATVDFSHTIIIATSNLGVDKIIAGWLRDEDIGSTAWRQQHLVPALASRFRLEFLNRWEAQVIFSPLSEDALYAIAELELQKITARLKHHHITITLSPEALREKIRTLADPRFGARPLKRWLEETIEARIAERVVADAYAR